MEQISKLNANEDSVKLIIGYPMAMVQPMNLYFRLPH